MGTTTHRRISGCAAAALLLASAAISPAFANYRQKAEQQTDWIQAHYYIADDQRYHSTYPVDPKGLRYATMWANGVQWRVLVDAARYDPAKYFPLMTAFDQGLQTYWDPDAPVPAYNAYCSGPNGTDKYYDDNEWILLGYIEAYQLTHDPLYLSRAQATQQFVLSGWDEQLGGGIYWSLKHQSKNTCSNAPAAAASALLYSLTGSKDDLAWALKIRQWTNETLRAPDGLYWDNENIDGKITNWEFTYNTALMIETDIFLYRAQKDPQYLNDAEHLATESITKWQDPTTGAFQNDAAFTHLLCESLLDVYATDRDIDYLNAVRRHAAFGYRYIRDPLDGGFWNHWTIAARQPDEEKGLLENASDARLFWLLAPYPDEDELYTEGVSAAAHGSYSAAEGLLQQAVESDTEAVEARYRLWKVLLRERKISEATVQEQMLIHLGNDPRFTARLAAVGWTPPTTAPSSGG